jgi:sugar-phosphatase
VGILGSQRNAKETVTSNNLPTPAGFLFDLDGTLINSGSAVDRAWSQVAQEAGIPLQSLVGLHGLPTKQVLQILLSDRDETEIAHWANRITSLEINDVSGIVAIDGAIELLDELTSRNIPWTIVTSCTMSLAIARSTSAGITMPAHSVTFDQVARGKPFPEPFILGASRLGIETSQTWAIEDAPGGITSAFDAGCTVISVGTTFPKTELSKAHNHLDRLSDLIPLAGL